MQTLPQRIITQITRSRQMLAELKKTANPEDYQDECQNCLLWAIGMERIIDPVLPGHAELHAHLALYKLELLRDLGTPGL